MIDYAFHGYLPAFPRFLEQVESKDPLFPLPNIYIPEA
jgi:hypothetical protein